MKLSNDRTRADRAVSRARPRFRIDKLEERIAPKGNKNGWDKNSKPPALPPEVVAKTRAKYIEAFETITGEAFAWK